MDNNNVIACALITKINDVPKQVIIYTEAESFSSHSVHVCLLCFPEKGAVFILHRHLHVI